MREIFISLLAVVVLSTISFASGNVPRYQIIEQCIEVSSGNSVALKKCRGGSDKFRKEYLCRDNYAGQFVDLSLCGL